MRAGTSGWIGAAVVVALTMGASGCVVGYAPDGSDPNETTGPDQTPTPEHDAAYLPMDAGTSFPGDDAWVMPTPEADAWVMPAPEVDAYVPPGHDAGPMIPDAWIAPSPDAYVCPTWAGSIHTLLDQHCGDCHTTQRPAFVNSQSSARTNASAIISAGTPPGSMSYRDPLGGFSAADDAQIRAWVACGAP